MSTLAALVPVAIIWELTVNPSRTKEFTDMMADNIIASRTYDGNLQFDVFTDPTRLDKVILIEKWESEEKRQIYMQWRMKTGGMDQIQPYFLKSPVLVKLNQAVE
ncbi:putative quinol monooxygenase [Sphingorhabdus sp. EL138]|jgi:quinol monooxygenase YgiN|uniref:putative quinol monooxygenase n=1 Tax=Sphingorhabdus sp. EL138 TaxID=2073156 RepID=UPI000D699894|nr:antibiotic biosynthesis monooxygenase [Sphingorhabdus sp. EL138]